jgi:hypothetical protein
MISTFLVEIHDAVPALLLVLIAGCVALGAVLTPRGERGRRTLLLLAAAATVPVLGLTLWPTHAGSGLPGCTVQFHGPNLAGVESLGNVALLVPAVLFLALGTRRPAVAALAGSALSAAIEGAQGLIPALGRSCDTDDWLANSIGAATGAVLATVVLLAARSRARSAAQRASRSRA